MSRMHVKFGSIVVPTACAFSKIFRYTLRRHTKINRACGRHAFPTRVVCMLHAYDTPMGYLIAAVFTATLVRIVGSTNGC